MADKSYEAPRITSLGSLRELTLGDCLDSSDGLGGINPPVSVLCTP